MKWTQPDIYSRHNGQYRLYRDYARRCDVMRILFLVNVLRVLTVCLFPFPPFPRNGP